MEAVIDSTVVEKIAEHFKEISSVVPLHPIHNEQEYVVAVAALNGLLDAGAADEAHPLADLVGALGLFIGAYEDAQSKDAPASPLAVLRELMNQYRLGQGDLKELGSQGVVSEVLNGKRQLNLRQVKALSDRFSVPPSVFL